MDRNDRIKSSTDSNDLIRSASFSHEQNLLCADQRTVVNCDEYCEEFFQMFDSLDLNNIDSFLEGPPPKVEFKMFTESQQLTGKLGKNGESLNGLLCKASFERVVEVRPQPEYDVLYLTDKTRGPLEFLVRSVEEYGKKMNLTVVAFERGLEDYLGSLPDSVTVVYKVLKPGFFSLPPGLFDFVYCHLVPPRLQCSGFLSKLFLKLHPKGIFAGTKPNPSRISATSGRDYLGVNNFGAAISSQSGRIFVDHDVSYHGLDPRLLKAPIAEIAQHPFFTRISGYLTQPSQDLHTGIDGIYFENDAPVRVEVYSDGDCFSLGPEKGRFLFCDYDSKEIKGFFLDSYFKRGMDSAVPASLSTLISAGTPFLVKEKKDGTPILMCSSFSGLDSVVFYMGKSYLISGDLSVFKKKNFLLTQWERMDDGSLSFSRPSGLFLGGVLQPYNFLQQLNFFTPRFLGIYVSSCSGLDTLDVKEGYVLTSPNSLLPNYSYSLVGASMHVKKEQTLDVFDEDKKVIEINLDKSGEKVRDRPDKSLPNTEKQILRILNSISVKEFLNVANMLGSIYPAGHQISSIKSIIDICDEVRDASINRKEAFLNILKRKKSVVVFQPYEENDYNVELDDSETDDE